MSRTLSNSIFILNSNSLWWLLFPVKFWRCWCFACLCFVLNFCTFLTYAACEIAQYTSLGIQDFARWYQGMDVIHWHFVRLLKNKFSLAVAGGNYFGLFASVSVNFGLFSHWSLLCTLLGSMWIYLSALRGSRNTFSLKVGVRLLRTATENLIIVYVNCSLCILTWKWKWSCSVVSNSLRPCGL